MERSRESIFIGHITDEDRSLKIRHIEEFTDSEAHFGFNQAIAAAKAKEQ